MEAPTETTASILASLLGRSCRRSAVFNRQRLQDIIIDSVQWILYSDALSNRSGKANNHSKMLIAMEKQELKRRRCLGTKPRVAAIVLVVLAFLLGAAGIAVAIWKRTSSHGRPAVQTTIRVVANAQDAGNIGYGGTVKAVWIFNASNEEIGSNHLPMQVPAGESKDIVVNHASIATSAARYINILAGEDDICVSYIEVIFSANTPKRTWFGNVATMCGQHTSRGNTYYQASRPSDPYWPDCVWLSATNTTSNVPAVAQIKIDLDAYTSDWKTESTADLCAGTIFSTHVEGPLTAAPDDTGSNNATSAVR